MVVSSALGGSRWCGGTSYLPINSMAHDSFNTEVLVPEEFDEVLRETFARHCSYGERLNTELMHSSKWIKMLGYGTDWLVVTCFPSSGSFTFYCAVLLCDIKVKSRNLAQQVQRTG